MPMWEDGQEDSWALRLFYTNISPRYGHRSIALLACTHIWISILGAKIKQANAEKPDTKTLEDSVACVSVHLPPARGVFRFRI